MPSIPISDKNLFKKIKNMEKAECHVHWDGAMDAETVLTLWDAKNQALYFPEKDCNGNTLSYKNEKERIIDTPDKLRKLWAGWGHYTIPDQFGAVTGLMQTKDDIKTMAKEHVKHLASQNILYFETRFAPQYHTFEGLSLDRVIGYSLEGFHEGSEETGTDVKLIVCIGREAEVEYTKKVVKEALRFQEEGVVAIDLACWEPPFPPELHYEAFKLTFDSSLKRTVHAGEMCSTEENLKNIYTAITKLKADGLGHAIPLYKGQYGKAHDLIGMVKEKGIRIESNPISNMALGFIKDVEDLHLDELVKNDVLITINSDDPSMWSNGSLSQNLYAVTELYGLDFLKTVMGNQIRGAFGLSKEEKTKLIKKIESQDIFK